MQKQTEILSAEHKNILLIVAALENECRNLSGKKDIDKEFFTQAIDFIRNYADKFHHAKEEDILFVEFCKNEGAAHCNPVDQMLYEHKLGREFVGKMEDGVKKNDFLAVAENGMSYANLLKDHIFKEDTILYPMMDEIFDEKTQQIISERSMEAEKKFAKEALEKYVKFAINLK